MSLRVGTYFIDLSDGSQIVPSIADSSVHYFFDKDEILLIPEEHILERYLKSLKSNGQIPTFVPRRGCFPKFVCLLIM
jgi:hypothetical protein